VLKPLEIYQLQESIQALNTEESADTVAAAVCVDKENNIPHAVLYIRFNDESKIFHYTGKIVLIEDADVASSSVYFYKTLIFIKPELIPAFVTQCELISEKAQPKYGFFYSGSLYDTTGTFIDPGDFPESMTCVGFCINVLKHFLGKDNLVEYADWSYSTAPNDFIDKFYEEVKKIRPSLTLNDFKKQVRRILPIEYFTAACADQVNIRKVYIDSNRSKVHKVLSEKRKAS
jgi:hypothetical protein